MLEVLLRDMLELRGEDAESRASKRGDLETAGFRVRGVARALQAMSTSEMVVYKVGWRSISLRAQQMGWPERSLPS